MSGTTRTKLHFEPLERKQMLAGDVLVSLVGGNLLIEGDAETNQIAITSGAEAGTYVIQGLEGTEVRLAGANPGDPPAPETGLVVEGVHGQVRVSLGEGDDRVSVHDAEFRRGLSVNTGAGNDTVQVGTADAAAVAATDADVAVRGSLLIRTGSENDTVEVGSVRVGGVLGISTEEGDDTVNLGAEAMQGVAAVGVGEGDPSTLHAKLGIDILLGEGTDAATLRNVSARAQIVVGGGEGADTIGLHDVRTGFLGIRGGDGDGADGVTLSGVKAHHALVALGDGTDDASIVDSAFHSLSVALGAGDDSLSIQTVEARRALLAGGEGDGDELSDAGNNSFQHVTITGFEIPPEVNTDPPFPRPGRPGNLGGSLARLLGRIFR